MRAPRYEVLGPIASGGMATVYVARMHGAGAFSRLVAVKKPHSFVTKDPRLLQQLQHEARVASMIHHPNVVAVLDVDDFDGELALVMDYVDGCTLKELLEHAQNAGERIQRAVVRILLDVAAGLHAAHSLRDSNGAWLGVVHRDVSPHNVLVGRDGIARLTDFGIAKLANLQSEPTAPHGISGKLSYAAPEYLSTKQFDAQSDLFSLGVVAWESLAQARLFQGATPVETMLKVLHARAPALDSIRPELAPLAPAVARALSRNAIDRQPSVQAFAEAIEAAARSSDGVASHAEVAELVERLAGAELATRRRELSNLQAGEVATPASCMPLRSARDEVATETLLPLPAAWQTSAPSAGRRSLGVYGVLAPLTCALALVAVFFGGQKHSTTANRAPIQQSPMKAARAVPLVQPAATSTAQPSAAPSASSQPLPRAKRVGSTKSTPVLSAAPGGASASPAQPAAQARADALLFPEQAPPNPYAVEANH